MKQTLYAVAILFGLVTSSSAQQVDENLEPARPYSLQLGDKTLDVRLNQPATVRGTFNNPEVTVRAGEFREFAYGGVKFKYPAYFVWEAETKEKAYKMWTLSGNDLKILYFFTVQEIDVDTYVESIRRQFPGSEAPTSISREFGLGKVSGKQFGLVSGGHQMSYEVYSIPIASGFGLLSIQDSGSTGQPSSEGKRYLPIIAASVTPIK